MTRPEYRAFLETLGDDRLQWELAWQIALYRRAEGRGKQPYREASMDGYHECLRRDRPELWTEAVRMAKQELTDGRASAAAGR